VLRGLRRDLAAGYGGGGEVNLSAIHAMSDARLSRARARCAYREQQARRRGRGREIVMRLRRALQSLQGEAVDRMAQRCPS